MRLKIIKIFWLTSFSTFIFNQFYVYFSPGTLYVLQVFSLEDGPGHNVWRKLGVPISIVRTCDKRNNTVDWLKYDCSSNFTSGLSVLYADKEKEF